MKQMRNPISHTTVPGWIELADRKGKKIYAHPKATIGDLIRAGVSDIGISKPETLLLLGMYRDTGKTG